MLRKQAKLFSGDNLIADFLRGSAELGDIYQLDDRGWVAITNVFHLLPYLKKEEYVMKTTTPKDISYTKSTGTEVKFSGTGIVGSIGKNEAEIKFGKKGSSFVSLKKASWQSINLLKIKPVLDELWKNNGYNKKASRYFFVNQVGSAESGVTIFSEDRDNVVKLRGALDQPLSSLGIIGEANVEIVANKKETLEIISPAQHCPLFQAVSKRTANGLWELLG